MGTGGAPRVFGQSVDRRQRDPSAWLNAQRMSFRASEQDASRIQELRQRFEERQADVDAARLFCIDEAGSTIAMTREYARAPRGPTVRDVGPRNRGTVITMIGALTTIRLTAMMTIRGGTDPDVFEAYVEHILVPELRAGDIVMLDNLGAHRTKRVLFRNSPTSNAVWGETAACRLAPSQSVPPDFGTGRGVFCPYRQSAGSVPGGHGFHGPVPLTSPLEAVVY